MGHEVDIFGQQPALQGLYTQLCFCFPSDGLSCAGVLRTLNAGIQRLVAVVPWAAGCTVSDASGRVVIQHTKEIPLETRLACKPDYFDIRKSGFSAKFLDESAVAPIPTLRAHHQEHAVLCGQLNFVPHGLLLVFCAQHNVLDMTGMSSLLSMLDTLCKGETLSDTDLQAANYVEDLDLLDEPTPALQREYPPSIERSPAAHHLPALKEHANRWGYIMIENTRALLEEAALPTGEFVSVDDVVTAFMFKTLTMARSRAQRFASDDEVVVLARAVDPRKYLGFPLNYPGILQNMVYTPFTVQDLVEKPLGHIAAALRRDLQPQQIARNTRILATLIERGHEVDVMAPLEPNRDLAISSWARVDAYNWTFGIKPPERVCRPSFTPVKGLAYIMPLIGQAQSTMMCISEQDWQLLQTEPLFNAHAAYVG